MVDYYEGLDSNLVIDGDKHGREDWLLLFLATS
jgi:hypothetical protein